MPDKKLTDNEIIKALKELLKELKSKKQLIVPEQGVKNLCYGLQNFLDLINRQKEENKRLSTLAELGNTRANDYRVMRDRALKAEAENERLREEAKTIRAYIHDNGLEWDLLSYSKIKTTDWLIKGISAEQLEQEKIQAWKSEAYKEFAERLKEKAMAKYKTLDNEYLYEFDNVFIDNLLKELVGEDNE